jgi:hypothetical protein
MARPPSLAREPRALPKTLLKIDKALLDDILRRYTLKLPKT